MTDNDTPTGDGRQSVDLTITLSNRGRKAGTISDSTKRFRAYMSKQLATAPLVNGLSGVAVITVPSNSEGRTTEGTKAAVTSWATATGSKLATFTLNGEVKGKKVTQTVKRMRVVGNDLQVFVTVKK